MRLGCNFADGEAFDEGEAIPLDLSMQLAKSIENDVECRSGLQRGRYAPNTAAAARLTGSREARRCRRSERPARRLRRRWAS